jgi:hypothetical protein
VNPTRTTSNLLGGRGLGGCCSYLIVYIPILAIVLVFPDSSLLISCFFFLLYVEEHETMPSAACDTVRFKVVVNLSRTLRGGLTGFPVSEQSLVTHHYH